MKPNELPPKASPDVNPSLSGLRFSRRRVEETTPEISCPLETPQRRRIQTCLDELRAISSKGQLREAQESGIAISNSGFQARAGVGSDMLRVKNKDLFDQLQDILDYIYLEYLGVTRNPKGRSAGPQSIRKLSDEAQKIQELEVLLQHAKAQILDLIAEIKTLRGS